MTDLDLRLRCLELANHLGDAEQIMFLAEKMYDFLKEAEEE